MPNLRFGRSIRITGWTTRTPETPRPQVAAPLAKGAAAGRRAGMMATTISGPRVLLKQLRETMAEPLASQARLDKIVGLIAGNMHADVCSFYVLRDDNQLELFANRGFKPEAVHTTTLRLGEGLVGLIAKQAE